MTATKKAKKRKKKSWLRRRFELLTIAALIIFVVIAGNWCYQVWRKPSELIGVFDDHFHKAPDETWKSYREAFHEKSTSIVTPEFLAALAQVESNGNPIVRTYWKWNWTTDLRRIFAPASSAVGMFQITEGTFEESRRFCIADGRVYYDGSDKSGFCAQNRLYSRLIPVHAIEMTAARLHFHAERIVQRFGLRRASLQDKQNLATIIHLCGVGKAERLGRERLRLTRIGRCGDHDPVAYVRRVRKIQARFQHLNRQETLAAHDDSTRGEI